MISVLLAYDNVERVYALTYTSFKPTGQTSATIRGAWQLSSTQIATHDVSSNIFRYITPDNLLIGNCAVNDGAFYQNRDVFASAIFGGGVGQKFKHTEFDPDTGSCGATSINYSATCNTAGGNIFLATSTKAFISCGTGATHIVFKFNPTTMAITFTSASLNGGAFPCNVPRGMVYDNNLDVTIITCTTGGRVVLYSGSEPSQATALASVTLAGLSTSDVPIAIDTENQKVYVYSTTTTTGIHQLTYTSSTLTDGNVMVNSIISSNHDLFVNNQGLLFSFHGVNGVVYDTNDSPPSFVTQWDYTGNTDFGASTTRTSIYQDTVLYIGGGTSSKIIKLDFTGDAGFEGGIGEGDTIGGIDCSLPENENILICRLGGDNNFGGIGNATGYGILGVACNVIFVSCEDANPQTNGLGLLAFIASLFVIVGMFYYAIGTEAFHMPIFIWIVIVVALSAFFTIVGLIDPIFLILTIVAIVAMAAPKVINMVKGGSTMGDGSTA
jgi:hypothetical protein